MSWRMTVSSSTTRTRPRLPDMARTVHRLTTRCGTGRLVASRTAPSPRSSGDRALPSGGRGAGSNPAGGTRRSAGQRAHDEPRGSRHDDLSNALPTLPTAAGHAGSGRLGRSRAACGRPRRVDITGGQPNVKIIGAPVLSSPTTTPGRWASHAEVLLTSPMRACCRRGAAPGRPVAMGRVVAGSGPAGEARQSR